MNSIAPFTHRLRVLNPRPETNLMLSSTLSNCIHSFPRRPLLITSTPFNRDSKFTSKIQSLAPLTRSFGASEPHCRPSAKVIFHQNPIFGCFCMSFSTCYWILGSPLFLFWCFELMIQCFGADSLLVFVGFYCRSGKSLALGMTNFPRGRRILIFLGRRFSVMNCRNLKLKSQLWEMET